MAENQLALLKNTVFTVAPQNADLEIIGEGDDLSLRSGEFCWPLFNSDFSLRLVQNAGIPGNLESSSHKGEFYCPELESYYTELTLLPICVAGMYQSLFEGAYSFKKENKPECYSVDGFTPSQSSLVPHNLICAKLEQGAYGYYRKVVCPYAVWGSNKEAPKCKLSKAVAFLNITNPDMPIPMKMNLKATALAAWNEFTKDYNRMRTIARVRGRTIYDYVIKLTVVEGANRNFYVPKFNITYDDSGPSKYLPLTDWYVKNLYFTKPAAQSETQTVTTESVDSSTDDFVMLDVVNGSETGDDIL